MATASKVLFRGAATVTTSTSLYTVPAATTAVITSIIVTNTSGSSQSFTMSLNDISLANLVTVGAYDSTVIDTKQVLTAAQIIKGGASATSVNFHISGVEIV
jgi:hypothetical protein